MKQPDRLGMLAVPGFHGSNDMEACMDWLDVQFERSTKPWVNRFVFAWNFDQWKATSGETVDLTRYPVHSPDTQPPTSLTEWNMKTPVRRDAIRRMLGRTPPVLMPLPADTFPAFRSSLPAYGPVEIAKGLPGNPGQLAPDVPTWVIAAGGTAYGWTAPAKDRVASRRIRFGAGVTGDLYYPADDSTQGRKLPTVVWLHGYHYPLGYMWVYRSDLHPILALTEAGFAVLAYDQSGFGTRRNEAEHFYDRFPHYSRMGRMIEDLHDAVDALQADAQLDPDRIFVYGYTMGGALGLYAAALDPRIRGAVSIAGFTPMRTDTDAKGTSGMTRHSHLYGLIPRIGLFSGQASRLPYDYDDLIALVAPRPVLIVQPQRDRDADPQDVRSAVQRARDIYTFNGASEELALQEPDDYARLTDRTQQDIIEWIKKHF